LKRMQDAASAAIRNPADAKRKMKRQSLFNRTGQSIAASRTEPTPD
jgi:hypothetical protein